MIVNLTVAFDSGETHELKCDSRDILAWERAGTDRALGQLLGLAVSQERLYSLAFATLRRRNLFTGKQAELEMQATVDMGHKAKPESPEVDETDDDPTQPDPSAEAPSS
jgi:hypothetical protein